MKPIGVEQIIEGLKKTPLPFGTLLLQGDELFLEREIKDAVKALGAEFNEIELKKTGPDSILADISSNTSLFSPMGVLWIRKCGAPSQWSAAAFKVWQAMRERADGVNFLIIVQAPMDKRISYASLEIDAKATLAIEDSQKAKWIKFINHRREAKLSNEKLRFLAENFDESLLIYDQWIELWNLGGDFWAQAALGWVGDGAANQSPIMGSKKKMIFDSTQNPAYMWVDAVLRGQHKQALKLLDHLLEEGSEALQLMALLSKSVRIMAHLESGQTMTGQAEFMVQKIRNVLGSAGVPKGRGALLLKKCVNTDRRLKSSQTIPRALMMRLGL